MRYRRDIFLKSALPYGIAVVAVILATMLKFLIAPIDRVLNPFFLYFSVIMLAGWAGGFWPAFFATILSAVVADYYFIMPSGGFGLTDTTDIVKLAAFLFDGVLISVLCGALLSAIRKVRTSEERLEASNEELDRRVSERTSELVNVTGFLDSLIENIPNMIFVKDAKDLRFVRFNRAGEHLLGVRREDLLGKNDYDFFPAAQADFFTGKDREVLANHELLDIPEESIKTSKGERVLHTKKIPLVDEEGVARYLLGISEDITEARSAERERLELIKAQASQEAAEKTVERMAVLAEASAALGASLDPETTLANLTKHVVPRLADWCSVQVVEPSGDLRPIGLSNVDPALSQLGWDYVKKNPVRRDATRGAPKVVRTGRPEMVSLVEEDFLRGMVGEGTQLEVIKKAGLVSYISVPLKSRGQVIGAMSFVTTKESNRRLDEDDLSLFEDLAERAALALDNARLYQASQMASRMKDDFLATVSHELRTPLNVIQGYSELILSEGDRMDAAEVRDSLQSIHRSAIHQSRIINDLLDVSAIVSGKIGFKPASVDAQAVLRTVFENVLPTAEVKGVHLTADLENTPRAIRADAVRLQQIAWNLLSNAIKFTPADGEVHMSAGVRDRQFVLEVRDSGIGIDPRFIPHLFESFRQEDSSSTRTFGGLGLGLSIVRHLVELHGGVVQARSEGKGQGAVFTVTIPLPRLITVPENGRPAPRVEAHVAGLRGLKVLLIEDSADNRDLVERILKQAGIDVQAVDSPPSARESLRHSRPDVIISDIGMPGEDGISFVRWLRKSANQKIPAIALTAYVRPEERAQALNAGFQAHVAKPATRETLLKTLASVATHESGVV